MWEVDLNGMTVIELNDTTQDKLHIFVKAYGDDLILG
jgi:hypothetical protein